MGVPGGAAAESAVAHPRRAVGTVVFVVFLDLVGFGIVIPILPFYVRSFGVGDVFIGLLAATYSLTQFVAAPLLGRLSDRFGSARLAVAGATLLLVALATLPFAPELGGALPSTGGPTWFTPELVALLAVLGLLSLGNGLLNPSLSTLVSTTADAEGQGAAFGVTQGAGSLGRTVGPPAAAALYAVAYWSPFVAGAVVVLPVLAVLGGLVRRESRTG
jgi:DHA1 family tetracycline resistance protein-like MFS transporter